MKFVAGIFAAMLATAPLGSVADLYANSDIGRHMLASARRLDNNNNNQNAFAADWVLSYSIKFQGCNTIKQWNSYADNDNDVRIVNKQLVRFRLCPTSSCSNSNAAGCSAGYGDYIVDMDTFVDSYYESFLNNQEYECANYLDNSCSCNDDDGKADDFNRDYCEFDCFNSTGKTECIENNPYADGGQEAFDVQDYMQCNKVNVNNGNNNNGNNNGNQVQYYAGPYCAGQGGSVLLGLFSDESCTEVVNSTSLEALTGTANPYATTSIVSANCLTCVETHQDNQNNGDAAAAVSESCQTIYMASGKCEDKLPANMTSSINTNACTYMEGVKMVRSDGMIAPGASRPSPAATAFIVIFAMAFAAMAFYVWYLRTRLGVKKNALL